MEKKYLFLILSMLFGFTSSAIAIPKNVILIRHAEKILKDYPLNLKGFERAAALPYYFFYTPLYNNPPISHVFAATLDGNNPAVRTIQTCAPTAAYYNLTLNTNYDQTETKEIAQELLTNPKYDNSTVLVCWTHRHIRKIVKALGGDDPGKWSKDVFNQVYVLTFEKDKRPKLQKIPQKLMFGD